MFRALDNLRAGLVSPELFRSKETAKRCNVSINSYVDIESVHSAPVTSLDIDKSNGSYLLSGCVDGSVYMHDVRNFTGFPHYTCRSLTKIDRNSTYAHKFSVETIQWYPFDTGLFITSGMDKVLKIWDAAKMQPAECALFLGRIYQHHFCPVPSSSRSLVALATSLNVALVMDIRTGCTSHELRGHTAAILTCRWSPTVKHLIATGSADSRVMLWDIRRTKSCLKSLDFNNGKGRTSREKHVTAHEGPVNGLNFTKDGLFLLSFGTDSRLRLWSVQTGENMKVGYGLVANDSNKSIQFDVSPSSSEECVYVPSGGHIWVFSVHNGAFKKRLSGHFNTVNCCYFDCFKLQLFSGANDRIILCWSKDMSEADREESWRNDVLEDNWSGEDDAAS